MKIINRHFTTKETVCIWMHLLRAPQCWLKFIHRCRFAEQMNKFQLKRLLMKLHTRLSWTEQSRRGCELKEILRLFKQLCSWTLFEPTKILRDDKFWNNWYFQKFREVSECSPRIESMLYDNIGSIQRNRIDSHSPVNKYSCDSATIEKKSWEKYLGINTWDQGLDFDFSEDRLCTFWRFEYVSSVFAPQSARK